MTEMQARLARLGINVSDKYNEPADHLAIELDLMGSLIIRAAESTTADQREAWLASRSPCCTVTCWAGSSASSRPAGPPTRLASTVPVPACWGVPQDGRQLPLPGQTGTVRRLSPA